MRLTPTPTQLAHAEQMASAGIMLDRSEPGTGKTLTSLLAAKLSDLPGTVNFRLLIVVPTIVREQWAVEAADMFPKAEIKVVKTGRDHDFSGASIVIVTYGIAKAGKMHAALRAWKAKLVILDEAHALKNRLSLVTRKVLGDGDQQGLIGHALFVWPLTGTPVRRYPDDLYPLFARLWPHQIKVPGKRWVMSYDQFTDMYCTTEMRKFGGMHQAMRVITGARNEAKLALKIKDISVKRLLSDMARELPPVTYSVLNIPVDEKPLADALRKDAIAAGLEADQSLDEWLKDLLEAGDTFLATVRNELAKQKSQSKELIRYILDLDDPVIVFFWHLEAMNHLAEALMPEVTIRQIHGGTSAKKREDFAAEFRSGKIDVLLAQIAAAGSGINLQDACHRVIFLERDWSPSQNTQAVARVQRMGQKFPVHCSIVVGDSFIDHAVENTIRHKEAIYRKLDV